MLLPKMSGPDVIKALKSDAASADIPIVVLTSLSQKNESKLMRDGADAFFEKASLDLDRGPDRLVAAVESVLNRSHNREMTP